MGWVIHLIDANVVPSMKIETSKTTRLPYFCIINPIKGDTIMFASQPQPAAPTMTVLLHPSDSLIGKTKIPIVKVAAAFLANIDVLDAKTTNHP